MSDNEKKELETAEDTAEVAKVGEDTAASDTSDKEKKSSKKVAPAKKESGFKKFAARSAKWFRELKSEFKKIVWPTRKQVIKNTLVVMAVIVLVGAFVALIDFLFQSVFLEGLMKIVTGY